MRKFAWQGFEANLNLYSYNFSWAPSSIKFAFPFPLQKKIKQSSYQRQCASRANLYDKSWSEFRFVSVRRFLDIKFAYKLSFQVFKIILQFSPTIRCFKANCGWYPDAAVSALRTLDRKIFRSKCNLFNEQAESTYFRQFVKMDNIFVYSKLNLRRNSGRPNERNHVTMWCQIAYTIRQKTYFIKNLFQKKKLLRFISACRKHLVYFWGAFLTNDIWIFNFKKTVWTTTVRKTGIPTENSDGAGRQCMRGKLIPHHGAGDNDCWWPDHY